MAKACDNQKPRTPNESPTTAIALVLGLGCLFSTLLIYSGAVISFLRFEHAESFIGTFAETTLLCATVLGALFLGLTLAGKRVPYVMLSSFGGAIYLCCSLTYALFAWSGSFGTTSVVALAFTTALADTCLVLAWGRVCTRFKIKRALEIVSLASILSALLCHLYSILPLAGVTALFVLASITAVIVPLALGATVPSCKKVKRRSTGELRAIVASLVDVLAAPGLGLIVFAFVMAVMRTSFNQSQDAYLAMLALDATILLTYALLRKRRLSLRGSMHQTFLPLMAMLLLAVTNITATVGQGGHLATYLTYALYALAAILTLATLCAIANAGEFPSDAIFSLAIFLFAAASFTGQAFATAMGDHVTPIAVTITTTLYAFAMVFSSHVRHQRDAQWIPGGENDRAEPTGQSNTSPAPASMRCAQLAETHNLTAREQEILSYLAEGHSGAYIADVLFISPNTARTHIHNIYRKLEVSSREDILKLTKDRV